MSAEVDLLLQEAKESIEAAQNYRSELQLRLQGLNQARKQIRGSSGQAREALKRHFTELQAAATRLLSERLAGLLAEVDVIEADSVKPLDDCQSLIEHGVGQADELLREGEAALRCGLGEKEDKLGSFTKKAMHIQLDSLPEVPALVDVPCVSAQLDDSLLSVLRDRVSRHGCVSSHPPVQIDELQERPGSILVRWCKVDEDFAAADYRLQYRRSGSGGSQYEDAYIGRDCEFLILHLDPHTDYLFRVCARGEGRTEWSPWSIPQTGYTTLAPHEWRSGTEGYILSSRRNIALRNDSSQSRCPVLYSDAPTYFCGQTLTFKISAAGQTDRLDSLGVCIDSQSGEESLQRDQAVCISTNGAVYVNGKEMTNQLPAIGVGSVVTFDMEVVNLLPVSNNNLSEGGHFKLRVTIGSGSREVVFDWLVDQAVDCLFFGCSFVHSGWKGRHPDSINVSKETKAAEWRSGTEGYILSSRRNIALRNDSSQSRCPVLYSDAPTYFCGQTLTFKISAAGQTDRLDSLGVCIDSQSGEESLQRDQAVCISTNGAVYVNGKEMTNQLPAIGVGSVVTFDMEVVNLLPVSNNNLSEGGHFKLRVTIGSGSREVVFDWLVDQAVDCLFFGCSFVHSGWKVLVF